MSNATQNKEASKSLTAVKAIRAKCLDCSCGNAAEVKRCELKHCALHKFRMGRNPNIKRTMTDEQKAAAAERLASVRAKAVHND